MHQCETNFQKKFWEGALVWPSADPIVPHVSILSYTLFSPFRRLWLFITTNIWCL